MKPRSMQKTTFYKPDVDFQYDIAIIGGGVMGCSAAYWLAQRVYKGLRIVVIEKDPTVRLYNEAERSLLNLVRAIIN